MANVTINLYRTITKGDFNPNGENINLRYEIQNSDWNGAMVYTYTFIVGSGSSPDFFSTYQGGLDYHDSAAFSTILSYLNGNTYISGFTFLQGIIQNYQKIVPGSHISDAPVDAPTNSPTNAPTNYGAIAAILGADANATNTKQNTIGTNLNIVAGNLNDTAAKLNTLIDHLESQGIQT